MIYAMCISALGHPRAMAMYFKAARSIDPLRFVMMSTMYEGVDTIQYTHEQLLATHFDKTMHLSQEEAMVWIAKAPREDLLTLNRKLGITAKIDSQIAELKNWRPTYKAPYSPLGRSEQGLNADVDDAVEQFTRYAQGAGTEKYLRLRQQGSRRSDRRHERGSASSPLSA